MSAKSAGGAGGVGLMSCVREGSLEPPYHPPHTDPARHGEGRTGRFLRGLRRMFKRRSSRSRQESPDPKSRSTSELLDAERHARRKEGVYASGLSVSHDSVFTGERSGDESSDDRPTPAHASTHMASSHRAELVAAVRRRGRGDGSDDDEDLGLPRSPPASPPTDKADKRHHAGISHSSCSDGSLLSVGSSEMDEDSSSGTHHHSGHDHSNRSDLSETYNLSEPPSGVAPLSHSAARHKMAVRPRRTHGAPRRKKNNPIAATALPITPELNEEMIRSTTPDVTHKSSEVVTESFSSSNISKHLHVKEHRQHQLNRELNKVLDVTPNDTKLKSSSLPPGLALSQLMGQAPKLTIAENDTPRSSIKRSKSSSQGKSLRDESPKRPPNSVSESHIHYSEDRLPSKYQDQKYAEESCLNEKKSKDKKSDTDVTRSNKKEESFFSRLLLRKSGKKSKKDQVDNEITHDVKKAKPDKLNSSQYKQVDVEKSYIEGGSKMNNDKNTHKSSGQRAYSNQMHRRLDNKGAYIQEGVYKDVYSAVNVTGVDYSITDLKIAEETDKMLNMDMKTNFIKRDEPFGDRILERSIRTSSKEAIDDLYKDSYNYLGHDRMKKPINQRIDPFSSKAFINNEHAALSRDETHPPTLMIPDEEPLRASRYRNVHNDYGYHNGSMPKNIPYFNHNLALSASVSPPKSIMHQSAEAIKFNRSSEYMSEYQRDKQLEPKGYREHFHNIIKPDSNTYMNSGLRSLGDEYVETRNSIGKSHSFRYASETTSISSQESQLPSLPAIVGISEPLLESWEANYRRSVSQNNDIFGDYKKVATRNFTLDTNEVNYDSLPSTDSSYLDSLKTETHRENERPQLFTNNIQLSEGHKRDSDISQIEAKIDDIISSPKPIISPILKSSSLDSVTSTPEKTMDDRRKTVSVESALSLSGKTSLQKDMGSKQDPESFISVTHLNKENESVQVKTSDIPKITKVEEKKGIVGGVPEFLKIQLNKVDTKPTTNVVLTANVTPKKSDVQINVEKERGIENSDVNDTKMVTHTAQHQIQIKKPEINQMHAKSADNAIDECIFSDDLITKNSPVVPRKTSNNQNIPQSPCTPKAFFKRKSTSVELPEKQRTNSISTDGSNEKIYDNISMDRKSHSSFGSKSSIQSTDSNEARTPDRQDDGVVFRRKPMMISRDKGGKKNDDEPELMKVFARRSLKLKDSEAETLAHDIAEATNLKEDSELSVAKTKSHKNEFNASIKSRDSDKENEDGKEQNSEEKRVIDIAARVSQFGAPHYNRSVSINTVPSNVKRESAPVNKTEMNKYKKEVSDATPEKRLRNRTFPDPANDRDDIKSITAKNELNCKADSLTKKAWQHKKDDDNKKSPLRHLSLDLKEKSDVKIDSAVIEKDGEIEKEGGEKEKEDSAGEADASPQFKGILQMRAEWERRAKQSMTK